MRTIKNKLNSQRGASLTFALLLFLVCAVVGSVVLVAGTAASGRLAGLADYEQRYYAVNSAAELLAKEIPSGKTTVTLTRTTTTPITREFNKDMLLVSEAKGTTSAEYAEKVIETTTAKAGTSLLAPTKALLEDLVKKLLIGSGTSESTWSYMPAQTSTYQYSISADGKPALAVDVTAEMTTIEAGSDKFSAELALDIQNHEGDRKYCVHMVFASDMIDRRASSTALPIEYAPGTPGEAEDSNPRDLYTEVTTWVPDEETGETKPVVERVFSGRIERLIKKVIEQRKPTVKWTLQSVSVSEATA